MYYVISAAHPTKDDAKGIIQHIQQNCALFSEKRDDRGEIHELAIDKAQFKIGSLDQLMVLNETAMKLDAQLENVCKKVEKVAFETMPDQNTQLLFYPQKSAKKEKGSKLRLL